LPEEQLAFFEALISEIKEQIANGNIEPILTKLSNLEGVDSLFQQASLLFTQFTKKKVNLNTVCSFKELYQKWLEKVADPNTPSSSNSINKHNAN
jgi:hypothetical protein